MFKFMMIIMKHLIGVFGEFKLGASEMNISSDEYVETYLTDINGVKYVLSIAVYEELSDKLKITFVKEDATEYDYGPTISFRKGNIGIDIMTAALIGLIDTDSFKKIEEPESVESVVKYYFTKCCKNCHGTYYSKEIDKQGYLDLTENPNINYTPGGNTAEIMSNCGCTEKDFQRGWSILEQIPEQV